MYISKIQIQNIRCFDFLELDFSAQKGDAFLWTTILGDNAVGKTCLLRSIAFGLCDSANAAALIKELPGDIIRRNAPRDKKENRYVGWVRTYLRLWHERSQDKYIIETKISKKDREAPEIIRQFLYRNEINPRNKMEPEDFPWQDIFVCAYGSQRASLADRSFPKYSYVDAVYTLFNYDALLQNPELVLRRHSPKVQKDLEKRILDILLLDNNKYSVRLTETGMTITGPWGSPPFETLSDGYRSTVNWVFDLMGWLISTHWDKRSGEITGVVLIDELEQHIHPKWQRFLIQRIKKQFPGMQFIVTTHSPLLAAGTSDIDDAQLVSLSADQTGKLSKELIDPSTLKGLRADEVLTSDAFNLSFTRSPGSLNDISEYYLLPKKRRNKKEETKYRQLEKQLSKEFVFGDSEYEKIVEKAVDEALDKVGQKKTKVLSFETKRQLRNIFKKV